jgi:hypothetical protein
VRTDVVALAKRLLGSHVRRRADHLAVLRAQSVEHLGIGERAVRARRHVTAVRRQPARQPPVHHVHFAEVADHHVLGLQVAMDHSVAVRERDRLAHAAEHGQHALAWPRSVAGDFALEHIGQSRAAHALHREVRAGCGVETHLVDRDDARVVELAGDARFLVEAHHAARPRGRIAAVAQHLEHEIAAEGAVARGEDRGHAARGQRMRVDLVIGVAIRTAAQRLERELRGGRMRRGGHGILMRRRAGPPQRLAQLVELLQLACDVSVLRGPRGELDSLARLDAREVLRKRGPRPARSAVRVRRGQSS